MHLASMELAAPRIGCPPGNEGRRGEEVRISNRRIPGQSGHQLGKGAIRGGSWVRRRSRPDRLSEDSGPDPIRALRVGCRRIAELLAK